MTPWDYSPAELARMAELMGARVRRRRIMAGEGMVTPRKPISVQGEILMPKRDRLSVHHEWVAERPELFTVAWSRDAATLRTLIRMNEQRATELKRRGSRSRPHPRRRGSALDVSSANGYGLGPRRPRHVSALDVPVSSRGSAL